MENLGSSRGNPSLKVVREDLKNPRKLDEIVKEHNLIFHLAANPEMRVGQTAPKVHFEENVLVTFNLRARAFLILAFPEVHIRFNVSSSDLTLSALCLKREYLLENLMK